MTVCLVVFANVNDKDKIEKNSHKYVFKTIKNLMTVISCHNNFWKHCWEELALKPALYTYPSTCSLTISPSRDYGDAFTLFFKYGTSIHSHSIITLPCASFMGLTEKLPILYAKYFSISTKHFKTIPCQNILRWLSG